MNKNGRLVLIWVMFGTLLVVGCKCNNGKSGRGDNDSLADTTAVETTDSFSMDALKQKDSASIFQNDTMSKALHRLSIQKDSWSNAQLTSVDTIGVGGEEKVQVDNAFLKKYADLLKVSPDGQYIIDLGSDNMIEDPATGKMYESDPETGVALLDKATGDKTILTQLGGSGRIVYVHWLDADKVAILCTLPGVDPKKDDKFLYVFNTKDRVMKTYKF